MLDKKRKIVVHKSTRPTRGGFTCVDLFSGAGGLAVGFRQAGFSVLAANDSDEHAAATFRLNFPEATFFEGSIAALTAPSVLAACKLEKGQLDCLIGGPPCQSFSYNNHHRSADDERARLFEDYIRLVKGLRPKILIMENVPGILTIGDNAVIKEIRRRLSRLGYDVEVRTLSAEEFGTPQIRRRVFIVASRIGRAHEILPASTHRSAANVRRPSGAIGRRGSTANHSRKKPVNVWQAIGDLPALENGAGQHGGMRGRGKAFSTFQRIARKGVRLVRNHVCHALTDNMIRRIRHVPEGGNWRDVPFALLPAGMQRAKAKDHTKRYGRLSRTGQASTVLTKCDPHWGAYVHPTQERTISVREAARLQGFPDRFIFAGEHLSKHYEQVGNAVPVPVAYALGAAAISHLKALLVDSSQPRPHKTPLLTAKDMHRKSALTCSV